MNIGEFEKIIEVPMPDEEPVFVPEEWPEEAPAEPVEAPKEPEKVPA